MNYRQMLVKILVKKKWNRPAMLPLTSDIKIFREHIVNVEIESYTKLKINTNNMQAYRDLQESILAQIVLKTADDLERYNEFFLKLITIHHQKFCKK